MYAFEPTAHRPKFPMSISPTPRTKASDVTPILKLLDVKRPFRVGSITNINSLILSLSLSGQIACPPLSTNKGILGSIDSRKFKKLLIAVAGQASSPSSLGKSTSCRRPRVVLRLIQQERIPPPANLITLSRVSNLTSSTLIKYSQTREAPEKAEQTWPSTSGRHRYSNLNNPGEQPASSAG